MLRSLLSDGALATAKGYSHQFVEPRHVLFAVAKQLRALPEVALLVPIAKQALSPRGSALGVPTFLDETNQLLDRCTTEPAAIAAIVAAYGQGGSEAGDQEISTQVAPEVTAAVGEPDPPNEPVKSGREGVASVLAELDGLIGLGSVKSQLRRVIAVVQANEERARAGLPVVNPGLHLVFTGPPGTGKTTVARLVARLYAAAGALPGATFVEASRSDLVAGYVGQTAIKTAELIGKARPGVLFIDEAYSLTPRHDSDFGAEAISTLVKAMEDYRHELAVIVAGYGEEMSDLIASNPGFKSRFKTYITFPDYTPQELTEIFKGFAETNAITLVDGVLEKAASIFDRVAGKQDYGNARFARFLFEEAYARMSARAAEDGKVHVDELTTLSIEDVSWHDDTIGREHRPIGFGGQTRQER